ncbi:MAG: PIG-L family deacetylase [Verrucomicrobiales bacterium]|nr:PIG-L family deacetylase [Verrucomicrobiales bacterium]
MAEPSVALAIAAHPDDIEFLMAGTLLLLKERGWDIHYFNLSTGQCGSATIPAEKLRRLRAAEARSAARILGATWHAPIADDLEIFYEDGLLRRVAAVVRRVRPTVVLTHALVDYMEDHMNTARLAVTATFARGMPNYQTRPRVVPYGSDATIYHAVPHGLRDPLGQAVEVNTFVNTSRVQDLKRKSLAAHASQRSWLDESQGMDSYLQTMEDFARELGRRSRRFTFAEGWARHNHLGFCAEDADPLRDALGSDYFARKS